MAGKHFDLDLDTMLGDVNASNIVIPSQKAIKSYVDKKHQEVRDEIDARLQGGTIVQTLITFRDWSK